MRSGPGPGRHRPLYPRLLRLRHLEPAAWQRAVFVEGSLGVAALLVLADLATAWTLLVLPLAVAAVVKANDMLAGALKRPPGAPSAAPGAVPGAVSSAASSAVSSAGRSAPEAGEPLRDR